MNAFESMKEEAKKQFPDATISVDYPEKEGGWQWLDVRLNNKHVAVEWRPKEGFGFFAEDAGYGEGPNEIFTETDKAIERLITKLKAIAK